MRFANSSSAESHHRKRSYRGHPRQYVCSCCRTVRHLSCRVRAGGCLSLGGPVTLPPSREQTSPLSLVIESVNPQGSAALMLLRQAAIEARALYPESGAPNAPWPVNMPTPPRGIYLVGFVDAAPVVCGSLRPLDERTAEVRRMFVLDHARRRGYAWAVLSALERYAVQQGYATMVLETGNRQTAAMALYRSCGYEQIEPFGAHEDDPTSVCYRKDVG